MYNNIFIHHRRKRQKFISIQLYDAAFAKALYNHSLFLLLTMPQAAEVYIHPEALRFWDQFDYMMLLRLKPCIIIVCFFYLLRRKRQKFISHPEALRVRDQFDYMILLRLKPCTIIVSLKIIIQQIFFSYLFKII